MIWAELLEKLVPVLSGISIALIAWLQGGRTAKLEVKAEALQKEADLKEQADEADRRLTADLNERSLRELAARSPDNAGPNQAVTAGDLVTLTGAGSTDSNGNPLTYAWTLTSKPAGSTATLTGATTVNPTFTADLAGEYVASLVVNDGVVNSSPSTVTVTAS